MKAKAIAIMGLLLLSATMITLVNRANAAPPTLYTFAWIEPAYVGYDYYYETYITGYVQGTYWNFTMSWTNYYSVPINISTIRMYFSWGQNYTFTPPSAPLKVDPGQTKTFTWSGLTPLVSETSELWTHSYDLYIHHVNATNAEITTPPVGVPSSPIWIHHGSDFAVLSTDHLGCENLWVKLHPVLGTSSAMASTAATSIPPDITKVYILMQKATMEFDLAERILKTGVFGEAKTHLTNADTLYSQALDTWDQRGTAIEDATLNNTIAQTNLYNAQADAERKTGDAALVNAYGTLLFGLGWVFIGLGVVVYGLRKPKTAPPPS